MLWQILVHFLFRLAGGLALAMFLTSPKLVTAGFFRVHLWVTLGLSTFAAAIVLLVPDFPARPWTIGCSAAAAVLSYVGAVIWLYERHRPGQIMLAVVAIVNLVGDLGLAVFAKSTLRNMSPGGEIGVGDETSVQVTAVGLTSLAETFTSSGLLGTTFAAMLLGHWYLNTPSMKLGPLRRLVLLMAVCVLLRSLVSLDQLQAFPSLLNAQQSTQLALLALRWLAGLLGVLAMTAMTWQTLKIPNTQSATGILYVAVIFVFLGELTAQLFNAAMLVTSGPTG